MLLIAETPDCKGKEEEILPSSCCNCWDSFSTAETQDCRVEKEERFSSEHQSWQASFSKVGALMSVQSIITRVLAYNVGVPHGWQILDFIWIFGGLVIVQVAAGHLHHC